MIWSDSFLYSSDLRLQLNCCITWFKNPYYRYKLIHFIIIVLMIIKFELILFYFIIIGFPIILLGWSPWNRENPTFNDGIPPILGEMRIIGGIRIPSLGHRRRWRWPSGRKRTSGMKILRYEDHLEERGGRSWLKRRERGSEETLAEKKGNLNFKIYSGTLTLIFS